MSRSGGVRRARPTGTQTRPAGEAEASASPSASGEGDPLGPPSGFRHSFRCGSGLSMRETCRPFSAALSARLRPIPPPPKRITPRIPGGKHLVVRPERRGLVERGPVGAEKHLRNLARLRPCGRDLLRAATAFVAKHHVGATGAGGVETAPDDIGIGPVGRAGNGDERSRNPVARGLVAVGLFQKFLRLEHGAGFHRAAAGAPAGDGGVMLSGLALVAFGGGLGHELQRQRLLPCRLELALRLVKLVFRDLASVLRVDQSADFHFQTIGGLVQ